MTSDSFILDGYFAGNIGDDLMVLAITRSLPELTFVVNGAAPASSRALAQEPNVLLDEGSNFRGRVLIGGSMFIDTRGRSIREYCRHRRLYLARAATGLRHRILGRPFAIIGCNIGPISTPVGRSLFSAVIGSAHIVTVRDGESFELARRWAKNVSLLPDIVEFWAPPQSNFQGGADATRILGVSPPPSLVESEVSAFADLLIRAASACVEEAGSIDVIRLFGFHAGSTGDSEIVGAIAKALRGSSIFVEVVIYDGDVDSFMEKFHACDRIIGARFHSIILARRFGIPVVPIAYSSKTSNYLRTWAPELVVFDRPWLDGSSLAFVQAVGKATVSFLVLDSVFSPHSEAIQALAEWRFAPDARRGLA